VKIGKESKQACGRKGCEVYREEKNKRYRAGGKSYLSKLGGQRLKKQEGGQIVPMRQTKTSESILRQEKSRGTKIHSKKSATIPKIEENEREWVLRKWTSIKNKGSLSNTSSEKAISTEDRRREKSLILSKRKNKKAKSIDQPTKAGESPLGNSQGIV